MGSIQGEKAKLVKTNLKILKFDKNRDIYKVNIN